MFFQSSSDMYFDRNNYKSEREIAELLGKVETLVKKRKIDRKILFNGKKFSTSTVTNHQLYRGGKEKVIELDGD